MGLFRNEADTLRGHRAAVVGLSLWLIPLVSGCHSAYVQADIKNASGQPISLLEVDYPSASFGAEALAAGAHYRYRFKILGEGPTKVLWTDLQHREHSVPGPTLHEGQQGMLEITITGATSAEGGGASTAGGASWNTRLQP